MDIRAEDVKNLREKTGAGMMDCKKALAEAGGDFRKAEKLLKEMGLAQAAKRIGRATNEGRIFIKRAGATAAILELSCETDFVARNKDFIAVGEELVSRIVDQGVSPEAPELRDRVNGLIAVIKENMAFRRAALMKAAGDELMVDYLHGEGRIGVLVKIKADRPEILAKDEVKSFLFDCALHIAAFNPSFLAEKDVAPAYLKEQEEIFTKQAASLGKPENVTAGIVKGKIKKHLAEVCLLDQPFVKDDKRSVAAVAQDVGKTAGGNLSITGYIYYRVGEEL